MAILIAQSEVNLWHSNGQTQGKLSSCAEIVRQGRASTKLINLKKKEMDVLRKFVGRFYPWVFRVENVMYQLRYRNA